MSDRGTLTGWSSSYYRLPTGATELQDLIEHKDMNFAQGNIFKAVWRLGEKTGTSKEYDLEKIIWFAQRELERLRYEQGPASIRIGSDTNYATSGTAGSVSM
jgi:hypothetical protein